MSKTGTSIACLGFIISIIGVLCISPWTALTGFLIFIIGAQIVIRAEDKEEE